MENVRRIYVEKKNGFDVYTVDGSSERTPLFARSSAKASKHLFQTAFVRSVVLQSREHP